MIEQKIEVYKGETYFNANNYSHILSNELKYGWYIKDIWDDGKNCMRVVFERIIKPIKETDQ